jgi:hypothetical protein
MSDSSFSTFSGHFPGAGGIGTSCSTAGVRGAYGLGPAEMSPRSETHYPHAAHSGGTERHAYSPHLAREHTTISQPFDRPPTHSGEVFSKTEKQHVTVLITTDSTAGSSRLHFIAVGAFAFSVYKSCKEAPESFGDIAIEVLSLHAVLMQAEKTIFAQPRSPEEEEEEERHAVAAGCYRVLKDLDGLIKKHESLARGTQGKRTWSRVKWGSEDVTKLRARLTSNVVVLNAWIRCVYMSS